jgi:hypothetical protein
MGLCIVLALALAACGKPVGLDNTATPLVQIHVLTAGNIVPPAAVDAGDVLDGGDDVDAGGTHDASDIPPALYAALVWGMQWLPEPFCVLPPESPEAAAVIAAGCRDTFGFVPDRVGADTPITPGVPATIDLYTLPAADVMVGDVTARAAYASVIVYEDRNHNGVLDLRHPQRQRRRGEPVDDAGGAADRVYGASFISMTMPDRRVAFREGDFNEAMAFYPRHGCPDPPRGFSILSASGFSPAAALASLITGQLPSESELSACATAGMDDTIVIPLQDPGGLSQLACTSNDSGGQTYYRAAPSDPPFNPSTAKRAWVCAGFPRLGNDVSVDSVGKQLVISSASSDPCRSTQHYTLRGCDNDPFCAAPSWDLTGNPPAWWPCATTP